MMARYLSEHRLGDVEALKGFDIDGYHWSAPRGPRVIAGCS